MAKTKPVLSFKYAMCFAVMEHTCPVHGAVSHAFELRSTAKTFPAARTRRVAICEVEGCGIVSPAPVPEVK